jgi:cell pole-organizing protein PopZ
MPSAKETLDKIAQAIGIATADKVETVEETVETPEVEATEEVVETADNTTEEVTEEVAETEENKEVADEVVETEEVTEEVEKTDEAPDDSRVKELESQINELKKIIQDSLSNETEEKVETPEIPVDDKGLTHSPEAEVKTRGKKLGNKGGDILSNVFKYIND